MGKFVCPCAALRPQSGSADDTGKLRAVRRLRLPMPPTWTLAETVMHPRGAATPARPQTFGSVTYIVDLRLSICDS
ncbi:MAG: hypothetical protein IID41_10705 [Planctomycetes bacterium]|nr:hypothetical protein [Planctomycetota bacterium]